MKLKKIASLALAGIMAVSMLAGCSNGSNGGNGDDPIVTPNTTPIVEAVNKGQSASNLVKINFTANSSLDSALQKAVSVYGNDATDDEVANAITRITGLKMVTPDAAWYRGGNGTLVTNGFLNNMVKYNQHHATGEDIGDEDGKTYTQYGVKIFPALTNEAALNIVANAVNEEIAKLAATSNDNDNDGKLNSGVTVGGQDKYYSYGYDGSISMVSVEGLNGQTYYYVAYVVNQTVTETTLK
ncbi:hypothetical protein B5G12_06485 [Faecalibacterium sp. An58]|uniref:hypothetical protein n=1 Tax=Faecalibacterium sp. An58 TaxID=1965648 RepID=UPI000B3A7C2A|nr:hypothetical protein [Faecalibacterium sp. An58]OUN73853.1 hypothetical protein B5G12_06485 [Faecalibacterium sp. An58]